MRITKNNFKCMHKNEKIKEYKKKKKLIASTRVP